MSLVESGVDYCRTHHGIRNEDEDRCDFVTCDPWSMEFACGHGVEEDEQADALDDCEACDEEGVTLCDLTPLLYEPNPAVVGEGEPR